MKQTPIPYHNFANLILLYMELTINVSGCLVYFQKHGLVKSRAIEYIDSLSNLDFSRPASFRDKMTLTGNQT